MNGIAPNQSSDTPAAWRAHLEHAASWLAWIYLILLPMNIVLRGPLFAHDVLAPLLALVVLLRGNIRRWFRMPDILLPAFLAFAALSTLTHFGGMKDIYELAIFAYMALLYAFFSETKLGSRDLQWYGFGLLATMWLFAAGQAVAGAQQTYGVYEDSTLGFIAKRFFFTFEHPNLLGSFYALPVLCVLLSQRGRFRVTSLPRWVLWAVAASIALIPLGLTVSRHMLLSAALLAAFFVGEQAKRMRTWRGIALGAVALLFLPFYLMILYPFFPLQNQPPFFNHATFGMYTVHQVIYLKMILRSIFSAVFGVGRSTVFTLYPTFADWDTTHAILSQYKQEFLAKSFTTYMDAHNEYLNIGASFGLPAVALAYGFWVATARDLFRRGCELALFLVVGLLLVSLWDDILSKRWIWICLALLHARTPCMHNPE
ncbi:MAG: O-antigen ligase family protein [Lentisphaeria bacterium]|nr:O-antigen ligase family protein [Lentisphaeria bacterium]